VVDHQGAIAGDVEQFTDHLLDANRTSAHADKCYHDDTPGRWDFPNSLDASSSLQDAPAKVASPPVRAIRIQRGNRPQSTRNGPSASRKAQRLTSSVGLPGAGR
jgi:hypothetical protein